MLIAVTAPVTLDLTAVSACDPEALHVLVAASQTRRRRDGRRLALSAGAIAGAALERAGVRDRFADAEAEHVAHSVNADSG